MSRNFGVIGFPLGHSFSPTYFRKKFIRESLTDCTYEAYPLKDIHGLTDLIKQNHLSGVNVTIPYKEKVLSLMTSLDESAGLVGAVNCIKISGDCLIGYNTDAWGFRQSFLPLLADMDKNRPGALILGTGGASKAVAAVFRQLSIPFKMVSSSGNGDLDYKDLDKKTMEDHDIIVNTTPLGMDPHTESFPDIPYQFLNKSHFLIDLIYNPKKTVFLTKGLQHHCTIKNGSDMLVYQAEKSWEIWNQK